MNRFTLCQLLATVMIAITSAAPNAYADFIISFGPGNGLSSGPVSFVEGQAGKINVFIRRDATPTPSLENFTVWVNLEKIDGLNANGLLFSSAQEQSQLSSPNYVFNSVSAGLIGSVANGGLQYRGTDTTTVNNAVSVPQSNRLLFSLDLNPIAQGEYRINVSTGNSSFISPAIATIPFTSTAGSISVTAVPEPSSFALLIASIGAATLPAWRRKRLVKRSL